MKKDDKTEFEKAAEEVKEKGQEIFDSAVDCFTKTMDSNVKMQRDLFKVWSQFWQKSSPLGALNATAKGNGAEQFPWIKGEWAETVQKIVEKRQEVFATQYQGVVKTMEAAVQLGQSSSPQEFRDRAGSYCRTSIKAIQAGSEAQLDEWQDTLRKCYQMATPTGTR